VKARTQKCEVANKSSDFKGSLFDFYMNILGGLYSNLYYILDLDFLRMYNMPYSSELGPDKRIWSTHSFNSINDIDNYNYYKAFKKDGSIYVVLVSEREFSIIDRLSNRSNDSIRCLKSGHSEYIPKDVQKVLKYVVVNLRTNTIEQSKYYHISLPDSSTTFPNMVTSYETSYQLVEDKYYLKNVCLNNFLFGTNIDHISLSGISFQVDSVITDPKKIEKIKDSEADLRKVNYLEQYLKNMDWRCNEKY
jgi:hypothetical protein